MRQDSGQLSTSQLESRFFVVVLIMNSIQLFLGKHRMKINEST